MRLPSIGCLLAFLACGTGLVDSSAIPKAVNEERSTDSDDAALRRIDWKIVRGGLAVTRDVMLVSAGVTGAIVGLLSLVQRDSATNSCAPLGGSGQSDDGSQKYNFKYWVTTTGDNCDTTAQTKTVASALDDAWDEVHNYQYNWACVDLSHGGTWLGHIAVATTDSGKNVETMCNR
ncbi:hypothetical protein BDW59DRAFT_161994 [Aspergillus cavernicola]|uniref:Secreted protein CSS2 C-terminal domain-containing protein n=1 Tax=Aspergillus cavernicola TaxID=176166 RepID=A0ABR4IBF1_9EURO